MHHYNSTQHCNRKTVFFNKKMSVLQCSVLLVVLWLGLVGSVAWEGLGLGLGIGIILTLYQVALYYTISTVRCGRCGIYIYMTNQSIYVCKLLSHAHCTVHQGKSVEQLIILTDCNQGGFDLPRQQWSLLNRFRTEQGHCGACRRKWRLTDTDLCPCGETQMMSHIVESCPLTKLNGT